MAGAAVKGVGKAGAVRAGAGPRGRLVAVVKARAGVKVVVVAKVAAAEKAGAAEKARAAGAAKVADRRHVSRLTCRFCSFLRTLRACWRRSGTPDDPPRLPRSRRRRDGARYPLP